MTKKIITIVLGLFVLVSIVFIVMEANQKTGPSKEVLSKKKLVVAYYFHTTARCYTCNLMEKYIKETIDTNFSEQVKKRGLVFKAINVDEPQFQHYVDDYKLYTKTLILSLQKDEKEMDWINCDKIWSYSGNEHRFKKYVKSQLTNFMEM